MGHNLISNGILKRISPAMEKHLVKAFIICWESRKVPDCMKNDEAIPLFDKGDCKFPEHCRPANLLTSLSKLQLDCIRSKTRKLE